MHRVPNTSEQDEGASTDVFRRTTLQFAMSIKRMVEAAEALGPNQKVSYPAVKDISHGIKMLKDFVVPAVLRTPEDNAKVPTAGEVRRAVADIRAWATARSKMKIIPPPAEDAEPVAQGVNVMVCSVDEMVSPAVDETQVQDLSDFQRDFIEKVAAVYDVPVALIEPEPAPAPKKVKVRKPIDLNAPVISRNGLSLWANTICPECSAEPTKRCKRQDGAPQEKPHPRRKGAPGEV